MALSLSIYIYTYIYKHAVDVANPTRNNPPLFGSMTLIEICYAPSDGVGPLIGFWDGSFLGLTHCMYNVYTVDLNVYDANK